MEFSGSPRVDGDEEEEDVDDLDNEFSYKQGNGKGVQQWQLQGQGEDADLSSSSRHEPHRIPRLTSGQQVRLISLKIFIPCKMELSCTCFKNLVCL